MAERERFELIELLGIGGFAQTYRAKVVSPAHRRRYGSEEVALKIPLSADKELTLQDEIERNTLLFKRLEKLDSTHIVRYLGFAIFDGRQVMVMEYIPDGNLRKMLGSMDNPRRLPVEQAVRLTLGVLRGLAVMHKEHFFHRDIKPENILMDGSTPKISDLGISRLMHSNELASSTTGTLYYMSPESLTSEGAGFTADIWSVGVTLYEMLAGRLPFGNFETTPPGTMIDLIRMHNPDPPHTICADVPSALSDIVAKAMAKNPAERFRSAGEMHDALKSVLDGPSDELQRELAAIREKWSCRDTAAVEAKLNDLMARFPRDPRPYQYLGEYYNLCLRHAEAVKAFKRGLNLDRNNAILHWDLALAYQARGETEAAARHVDKALALGLDPGLRRHAANLLRALRGTV